MPCGCVWAHLQHAARAEQAAGSASTGAAGEGCTAACLHSGRAALPHPAVEVRRQQLLRMQQPVLGRCGALVTRRPRAAVRAPRWLG